MKLQQWANQSPFLSNSAISSQFWGQLGTLGSSLVTLPLQAFGSTVDILLVVVISAYWLAVAPELRKFFLSLFPHSDRYHTDKIVEEMGIGMGGYIRGTFIVGVIFGILVYITMLLLGVHFSLMLGVLAGVMEMIPYVGPFISGAAMIAIAVAQSPGLALIVLLAAIILQELEGHVLVPIVMRTQTDISPLLAVIVLFAGASIGGLIGALTAIPLAVAMRVLVNRLIAPAIRRRTGAVGPVEEKA
jgi:predicted PurR-regulated permease PerM